MFFWCCDECLAPVQFGFIFWDLIFRVWVCFLILLILGFGGLFRFWCVFEFSIFGLLVWYVVVLIGLGWFDGFLGAWVWILWRDVI